MRKKESENSFDRSFFEIVEKNISEKEYLNSELYKNENTYFPKITLIELKNILKTLKDDSASGPDNINNQILKNLPDTFSIRLIEFFNLCLENNDIPDSWKISKITMIQKKTISHYPSKYRPMNVTSCLAHNIKAN
ncbi:RNA-directed DNA polymerase from mobile element [Brachionus plicatilis]|uniref:RNA-directed DNA polymerase from mobile element n=1 Tax=Brachionus plicatilis TaxID=10195 RepID=A0A3M7QT51_BRAPC|nr:RNA-directed DNA polymerase from mobile element [Brachionus plicatilis]